MNHEKPTPSLVFDHALLKEFINGKLEPEIEERVAAHLENRPDLRAKVAAVSGDGFVQRLKDAKQRSIAAQSRLEPPALASGHGEPTAIAAGLVESTNSAVRPEASAHGSRKLAHSEPSALVAGPIEPQANRHQTQVAGAPNQNISTTTPVEFPGYEIIKELGRGGMGVVYLAKNIEMDRLEVLKVLSDRLLNNPGAEQRFKQEIRAISKLNHPNIVISYSLLRTDSQMAFAMEYVHGIDLHKFIHKQQILPVGLACSLARQIAAGLQHAHEKGLVHRDIKPSNAMLYKSDGQLLVKILDFGLAKATSEKTVSGLTQDGTMLGTPEYMAPEQMLNAAKADIRADIYSLGCTLYHMLAGHSPFTGTQGEIIMAHAQTEAEMVNLTRPEVPIELAAIVAKMMAKSIGKRYQTPGEVTGALTPFIGRSRVHPNNASGAVALANTVENLNSLERDTSVEVVLPSVAGTALAIEPTSSSKSISSLFVEPRQGTIPTLKQSQRRTPKLTKFILLGIAGATLAGIICIAASVLINRTSNGTIVFDNLPADADVLVDGKRVKATWDQGKRQAIVTVKPGPRNIEIQQNGLRVEGRKVTVSPNKQTLLVVRMEPTSKKPADGSKSPTRRATASAPQITLPTDACVDLGEQYPDSDRTANQVTVLQQPAADTDVLIDGKRTVVHWDNTNEQAAATLPLKPIPVTWTPVTPVTLESGGKQESIFSIFPSERSSSPEILSASHAKLEELPKIEFQGDRSQPQVLGTTTRTINTITTSQDGRKLFVGTDMSEDRIGLYVFEIGNNSKPLAVTVPSSVRGIVHFADRREIVLCGERGFIRVIDDRDFKTLADSVQNNGQYYWAATRIPGTDSVLCVSDNGDLVRWNVAARAEERRSQTGAKSVAVAVSHDGKFAATGHSDRDHLVRVWDLQTNEVITKFEGHAANVRACEFCPENTQIIVSADATGKIICWDSKSGSIQSQMSGHTDTISSLRFVDRGRYIATGSADHTIRVWDITSGREVHRYTGQKYQTNWFAIAENGATLISGGGKFFRNGTWYILFNNDLVSWPFMKPAAK